MNMFRLAALLSAAVSVAAFAAPPSPLPVPASLPPCELGLPEQAQALFPCGVLVEGEALSSGQIATLVQADGATLVASFHLVNGVLAQIPGPRVLGNLMRQGQLHLVPNRRVMAVKRPAGGGGDTGGSSSQLVPDGVKRIGAAPGVLPVSGSGVGVAIVDTGVDLGHADLRVGASCFDAFGGSCVDAHGHGTHVAGIVGALNNSIDVVGVASGATVYAVRVLDETGSGSDASIIAGLEWVAAQAALVQPPIKVVNMSLGREGVLDDSPLLRQAVQAVDALGVTVVVAAGNDATLEVKDNVPATYPEVLAVASTTAMAGKNQCKWFPGVVEADTASFFSTDGAYDYGSGIGVTISAPGAQKEDINRACMLGSSGILSLKPGGGTTRMSGTSMASPHVAGVVALMVEQFGAGLVNSSYAREQIRSHAVAIGGAPKDSPSSSYTFDGEREGVVSACQLLGVSCP